MMKKLFFVPLAILLIGAGFSVCQDVPERPTLPPQCGRCVEQPRRCPEGKSLSRGPGECCDSCKGPCANVTCEATCRAGYKFGKKRRGECCRPCLRIILPCSVNGKVRREGERWKPTPCETCYCIDGAVRCRPEVCPNLKCRRGYEAVRKEGQCCATCQEKENLNCSTSEGETIAHQESWNPSDCETCFCDNGFAACASAYCVLPVCEDGYEHVDVPGQCCHQCQKIVYDNCTFQSGEVRVHNETWQPTDCSQCKCTNGRIACKSSVCPPPRCQAGYEVVDVEGRCCHTCKKIEYVNCTKASGEAVAHGDAWKRTDCSSCTCSNGTAECAPPPACPALKCGTGYQATAVKGRCCKKCRKKPKKHCRSKLTNGVKRRHGTTWKTNNCKKCRCRNGFASCRRLSCEALSCSPGTSPRTLSGQCCPICFTPSQ